MNIVNRNGGFTLIEIMAVLVILGVLTSVAVKKMNNIGDTAELRALQTGIAELNSREMLTWTDQLFAQGGFFGDGPVWTAMDTDLGNEYSWPAAPDQDGGTIRFGSQTVTLSRTVSSDATAARWQIQ
jgi:MSHA pilin protein MshA